MIIDCISDLHGFYPELEEGDLLIVAGDLTARDEIQEYESFVKWLNIQKYKKKIIIAGNHDNCLQNDGEALLKWAANCDYLYDSGTEYEGLKIWGSPWTKTFPGMNPHCKAFTCDTEEELASKFSLIPRDTDILITHSPPYGILDTVVLGLINGKKCVSGFVHCGSRSLSNEMEKFPRPQLHVFGHIHEKGGQIRQYGTTTQMINASHVNEHYQPVNKPIRVIL